MDIISNPKIEHSAALRGEAWYEYYAGYSPAFVSDAIGLLDPPPNGRILDPWNGSGTTTFVARKKGLRVAGFDINPALVLVAKGRLVDGDVLPSIPPLTADIIRKASRLRGVSPDGRNDPLRRWFGPTSARSIRAIDHAIQRLLIEPDTYSPLASRGDLKDVSSLASFFFVALFRTVRMFLRKFTSSNPTWVKAPATPRQRIKPYRSSIHAAFRDSVETLTAHLATRAVSAAESPDSSLLSVAPSELIPLEAGVVDVVLASPPYCTRIDYAVATLPELAVLGIGSKNELKSLRDKMIGTPTIRGENLKIRPEWGTTSRGFLNRVRRHQSQASGTYYLKYYLQYFESLYDSLRETSRVLSSSGRCGLVVQDSFYKEIHLDLQGVVNEMATEVGLRHEQSVDFEVPRTKAAIHVGARKYRDYFGATESLLVFSSSQSRARGRRGAEN